VCGKASVNYRQKEVVRRRSRRNVYCSGYSLVRSRIPFRKIPLFPLVVFIHERNNHSSLPGGAGATAGRRGEAAEVADAAETG